MKFFLPIVLAAFFVFQANAQTDGITYQAVIIDMNVQQIPGEDIPSNNLPNQPLQVRFSIYNENESLEYQEVQDTETDPFGMIHLTIGKGQASGASFEEIYWIDKKTLNVEIDLNDGNGFVNFSSQELTYIPYVKHREIIATSTLDVDGVTNLNNSLHVNNNSPTTLSGTLTVDGETNLNSDFTVNNQATTLLTGDLYVEGSAFFQDGNFVNLYVTENTEMNVVDIFGNTTIDGVTLINGVTNINNDFNVINQNPSLLTGSLQVDGVTNLNSTLNVNNQALTTLSGDLIVEGNASFSNGDFENLTVSQNTNLNTLNVSGVTTLNNRLDVINQNPTSLTGSLDVDGITVLGDNLSVTNSAATSLSGTLNVQNTSTFNNSVTISANVNGNQTSSNSYPLKVSGSNQGIQVTVDGFANNASNYMTFRDSGGVQGGIEGQSFNDLTNSFEYDYFFRTSLKEIAFIFAEGAACAFQIDLAEATLMAAEEIAQGIFDQEGLDYFVDNRGVYFKSGGADYAEYLPILNANETFKKGDVVGVYGGYISKTTKDAKKIMVISSNPIVLGNLQEEDELHSFEKVAFLGQVPVRVYGAVSVGDYILASGNNDGSAIAKHPDKMNLTDYNTIIGVAWEASKNNTVNLINTAVGINQNDLTNQLMIQKEKLVALENRIKKIEDLLDGKSSPEDVEIALVNKPIVAPSNVWVTSSNDVQNFEIWLKKHQEGILEYTKILREVYQEKNLKLSRYPKFKKWLDDPIATIKEMNNGSFMPTLWKTLKPRLMKL